MANRNPINQGISSRTESELSDNSAELSMSDGLDSKRRAGRTGSYDATDTTVHFSNIEMRESNARSGLPKNSSSGSMYSSSRQTSTAAEEMGGDTFDVEGELKFNTEMNAGYTRQRASSSFAGIRESFIKAAESAKAEIENEGYGDFATTKGINFMPAKRMSSGLPAVRAVKTRANSAMSVTSDDANASGIFNRVAEPSEKHTGHDDTVGMEFNDNPPPPKVPFAYPAPQGHVEVVRPWRFRILIVTTIIYGAYFIWWRFYQLWLNPEKVEAAHFMLLFCEIFSYALLVYSAVEMWTLQERKRLCLPIPADYQTADTVNEMNMVPTVDILLPSCGEPLDIIQDTVRAALSQDYPRDRFQVYVCDDKASDELRDWCKELRSAGMPLMYVRRFKQKGVPHHAKAGNMNHALGYSTAEFFAVLDADMIVSPNFLRHVLPHFYADDVAMVQTPQSFYNIPDDDPFAHENTVLYEIVLKAKDYKGCVPCVGTGMMFRRSCIAKAGGFTYGSITEDFNTTMTLHQNGFRTAYLNERFQWGLAPETLRATVRQRQRWCMGSFQLLNRNPGCDCKLSWTQRFLYCSPALVYVGNSIFIFYSFTPPLSALGVDFVLADTVWFPRYLLAWIVLTQLTVAELYRLANKGGSRGGIAQLRDSQASFWMAPYIIRCLIKLGWMEVKPYIMGFWEIIKHYCCGCCSCCKPKDVSGGSAGVEFKVTFNVADMLRGQQVMATLKYLQYHIGYIVVSLACNFWKLSILDWNSCIDLGAYITYGLFQLMAFQAYLPIIAMIWRKSMVISREQLVRYDADGNPFVVPPAKLSRLMKRLELLTDLEMKAILDAKGVDHSSCADSLDIRRLCALYLNDSEPVVLNPAKRRQLMQDLSVLSDEEMKAMLEAKGAEHGRQTNQLELGDTAALLHQTVHNLDNVYEIQPPEPGFKLGLPLPCTIGGERAVLCDVEVPTMWYYTIIPIFLVLWFGMMIYVTTEGDAEVTFGVCDACSLGRCYSNGKCWSETKQYEKAVAAGYSGDEAGIEAYCYGDITL